LATVKLKSNDGASLLVRVWRKALLFCDTGEAMFSELALVLMILSPCFAGVLLALLISMLASDQRIKSIPSLYDLPE
jgi:hypothetical protein